MKVDTKAVVGFFEANSNVDDINFNRQFIFKYFTSFEKYRLPFAPAE